jgi:hypothetical protein
MLSSTLSITGRRSKEGEQADEKKLGVDGLGGGQPGPVASGASDGAEADRSSDQGQTGQGQ